jgi:hypothetical protein
MGRPKKEKELSEIITPEDISINEDKTALPLEDKEPLPLSDIPVQEEPSVVIVPIPRRPSDEKIIKQLPAHIKIKEEEPIIEDKPIKLTYKPEVVTPITLVSSTNIPKSAHNYAKRNVALINDINNIITSSNPSNSESHGVFKIKQDKPINNIGKGTYK